MSLFGVVFRKELKDHMRDRRSVITALVVPVAYPLVMGALFTLIASWVSSERPLRILVSGGEHAPSLVQFLTRSGADVQPAPEDYEQKVKDGEEDVVLVIPADYAERFREAGPSRVELVHDGSRNRTEASFQRARALLTQFSSQVGALRLLARGVSPSVVQAVRVEEHDVSTKRQQGAQMLNMIPLMLLLSAFIGGMHVAIDTTAGERERGSLESLLLNPVPTSSLVLGKWLATAVVAGVSVTVTLVGFAVVLRRIPLEDLGIRATLGVSEAAWLLAALAPLLCFGSAVQMLASTFARSFKEAQTYLSMLVLVPALPGTLLSIAPFKPQTWMYAVPALGQQLLMGDVMRADPVGVLKPLICAAGTLTAAGLCAMAIVRLLGSEKVVFGRS